MLGEQLVVLVTLRLTLQSIWSKTIRIGDTKYYIYYNYPHLLKSESPTTPLLLLNWVFNPLVMGTSRLKTFQWGALKASGSCPRSSTF